MNMRKPLKKYRKNEKLYKEAFVISDVHGCLEPFLALLDKWNKETQVLVLLGDYIDRGKQSYEVLQHIMQLKETYGTQVVVCKGNHEVMFLDAIRKPHPENYYAETTGLETINSFLHAKGLTQFKPKEFSEIFSDVCQAIDDMLHYYTFGNVLFTHAGFQSLFGSNWENTAPNYFLFIRDHYKRPNKTGYVNVFGHTPTHLIHNDFGVWTSNDNKYVGIDGGYAYGGNLNAIVIHQDGHICQTYEMPSPSTFDTPKGLVNTYRH